MIPLRLLSPCIEYPRTNLHILTANTRENSSILDIFHPLTVKYRVKFQEFPFINHLSKSLDKSKSKSHRTPWSTSNVTIVPYKVTTISQIPDSVESRQKSKNRYNYTSLAISIVNVTRFWAEKKAEHSEKSAEKEASGDPSDLMRCSARRDWSRSIPKPVYPLAWPGRILRGHGQKLGNSVVVGALHDRGR